jgi:hypothetical protein
MALLDGAWLQAYYQRLCIRFAVQWVPRQSFGNSIVTLDGTFGWCLVTGILSQTVHTRSSPIRAASVVWKLNCDVGWHFWMVLGYKHIIKDCAYAFLSNECSANRLETQLWRWMALLDGAWLQAYYHRLCLFFPVQLEPRQSFGNSIVTLDGTFGWCFVTSILLKTVLTLSSPMSAASVVWKLNCGTFGWFFVTYIISQTVLTLSSPMPRQSFGNSIVTLDGTFGWYFVTCILSQTVFTLSNPMSAASIVKKLNCDVGWHVWIVLGYRYIITDCAYAFQSN